MSKKIRRMCLLITEKIYKSNFLNKVIEHNTPYQKLSKTEKSLVNMTILTMLRRNGEIESIVNKFLKKPLKPKHGMIKNILRLSTTQILYMNLPDHSIVNGYVDIVKEIRPGYGSLVNGILRNICRNKKKLLKLNDTLKNLPEWIKHGWRKSLSKEIVNEISKILVGIPKTDIHIKKKIIHKKDWEFELGGKLVFNNIIRLNNTRKISGLVGYKEGDWWVQNAAASIPVKIIENYFRTSNKISVLEVGSAPGGKTIQLLDAGFVVTAIEKSLTRTEKLRENLKRVNLKCEVLDVELEKFQTTRSFDCCLLDVSCTSSGIVGRKPEILILKKSLNELVLNQEIAINKASKLIRKDGILVYCVCSLIFEEGENQTKKFLEKNKNFRKIDLEEIFSKRFDVHFKNKDIMTLPINYKNLGGLDGFYISCLQKFK